MNIWQAKRTNLHLNVTFIRVHRNGSKVQASTKTKINHRKNTKTQMIKRCLVLKIDINRWLVVLGLRKYSADSDSRIT